MLIHARSPLLHAQMVGAELVVDDDAPVPFVRIVGGLCMTLAHALETHEVFEASAEERATLASLGVAVRPSPAAS